MTSLNGLKLCAAMRHEPSLYAVFGFVSGLGADIGGFRPVVMDRAGQAPEAFDAAKLSLLSGIASSDMIVLASKVNGAAEADLIDLLSDMKQAGLGTKPVVVTFLNSLTEEHRKALGATGVTLHLVENDNLGWPKPADPPGTQRTGMSKLGPAIIEARRSGKNYL
jgi:hypothetical protein